MTPPYLHAEDGWTQTTSRLAVGRVRPIVALWVAGLSILVGCSTQDDGASTVTSAMIKADARDLEKNGYSEQAAMLEDGEITAREYQDAFDLMRVCVEEGGLAVAGPYTDPLDGFSLDFAFVPVGGEGAEFEQPLETVDQIIGECQDRYWIPLGVDYEGSHMGQMDAPLREAVSECLTEAGFEISGGEKTVQDFVGEQGVTDEGLTPRAEAASQCMNEALARLYPDREAVGGLSFE